MTGSRAEAARLTLDPIGQAVGVARRFVCEALANLDRHDVEDSAVLGVSELVTNALIHARSRFTVTVCITEEGRVRVTVHDGSSAEPRPRHYDREATTGRGLRLVEAVSSSWGVDHGAGGNGKDVWFEPIPEASAVAFASEDWLEGL